MQFYNATNKSGLVDDVLFLCQTTTGSYPLPDITRNINQEYHDVTRLIWEVADGWQYDDTNASAYSIATADLVSGKADYTVPTTAQRIQFVEVKDSQGNWKKVGQSDLSDFSTSPSELYENSGDIVSYDLFNNAFFMRPAPDYNSTGGLKIYYDRDVIEFTTASTTATPGFATPFHRILSLGAASRFEVEPNRLQFLVGQKQQLVEGMKKFYGHRNVERPTTIRPASQGKWRQYL